MEDFKSIKRTFGYGRVSTREQDIAGVSPKEQEETITTIVDAYMLPALVPAGPRKPIFFDVESGTEEAESSRKNFQRLLKQVRAGDLVLVPKLDRISRDLIQPLSHVRELKKRGAVVYFISERLDSRDPHAETMIHMWAMGAAMEHKRIKERTQGGRRYLRRRGCFVEGKPPFGYVRPPHDREGTHRKLVIDPSAAAIIKDAFEQAAAGMSAIKLCHYLTSRYPATMAWGRAWILRMLRNRVYAGQIAVTPVRPKNGNNAKQLPAEWVDAHEPIVSMDLFDSVQIALGKRKGRGRPPRDRVGHREPSLARQQ